MDVALLFSISRLNVFFTVTGANLQNFGIFYLKFLIRLIKPILPSSYGMPAKNFQSEANGTNAQNNNFFFIVSLIWMQLNSYENFSSKIHVVQ